MALSEPVAPDAPIASSAASRTTRLPSGTDVYGASVPGEGAAALAGGASRGRPVESATEDQPYAVKPVSGCVGAPVEITVPVPATHHQSAAVGARPAESEEADDASSAPSIVTRAVDCRRGRRRPDRSRTRTRTLGSRS